LQGVLAQAKNGDALSWEQKFHAADGKAQACSQGALLFFLSSLGRGGEGEFFFSFFPGSQCVPTILILSSQWDPNMFPKFPMCSATFSQ
jgi:hypothetical protein